MKSSTTVGAALGLAVLLSIPAASPAQAANECKIRYAWNTGNSLAGTFKNHSKTIRLDKGQTKTINKNRMNAVRNLKNRKVKFYLDGAANVTLGKDQRNPVAGNYVSSVKLKKAKCLSGSGNSSASAGSKKKKKMKLPKCKPGSDAFPNVVKTPTSGGSVPIPYPNVECED